jgi:hypothetical protein
MTKKTEVGIKQERPQKDNRQVHPHSAARQRAFIGVLTLPSRGDRMTRTESEHS